MQEWGKLGLVAGNMGVRVELEAGIQGKEAGI